MVIELYNEDCLIGMKRYPDKYFDLAIVDPNYGIGNFIRTTSRRKKVNRKYGKVNWNNSVPEKLYFLNLSKISKKQIIFGANYYNCFTTGGTFIWDKGNNHPDMSRCEIASLSFKKTIDYLYLFNAGFSECNRIHPCQKPVKLYEWLLKNYAKEGDKILDTHGGSMSIAIACHNMKHDLVLFEIDKDYFEAGKKRLEEHQKQEQLF